MKNVYSPPSAASMVSDATEGTNPFFRESHAFICLLPKQSLCDRALWRYLELLPSAYDQQVPIRKSLPCDRYRYRRVEPAAADGKIPEYALYLEAVSPESTEYWVFVVLPYESAQAWFDARRAYHGRKAEGYYGDTRKGLESAYTQGFRVKAELRSLIEKGMTSVKVPEDVIMNRVKFQPVFDLRTGRRLTPAATTQ